MKICLVTPAYKDKTPSGGGIGVYLATQAEALNRQGHEVHVLIAGVKTSRDYQENGIFYHELNTQASGIFTKESVADRFPFQELFSIWKTSRVLSKLNKKYGFDIIEATSLFALCLLYSILPHRTPVVTRVVTTLEMTMKYKRQSFSKKEKIVFWLEKKAIEFSDRRVTHTQTHRSELCAQLRLKENSFVVIPLGVPVPGEIQPLPAAEGLTILYVGRMETRKGTDVLLAAVPMVLQEVPSARFIFVGYDHRGKFEAEFRRNCSSEAGKAVEFKGEVSDSDLQRYYASCDMLAVPSRYESFGLMYVEAMLHEKPVIGCRAGGALEVIRHGVTGLLAAPDDAADLAGKIILLAKNDSLRQQLGRAGKKEALERFSQDVFGRKMAAFYSQICRKTEIHFSASQSVKVSIVIPTYDRSEVLGRALQSIQAQDFKNYEVLVIQNGPSQNAEPVVRKFQEEGMAVSYFYTPAAGGANARNVGIEKSRGEFVAFLDDDDEWVPKKLSTEVAYLDRHKDVPMVFSHPLLVYSNGNTRPDSPKIASTPTYKDLIEHGCVIRSFSGVTIRKSCFNEVGLLDTRYQIANDFEIYLRITRRFQIGMIEEPLYRYSVHESNLSRNIQVGFEEFIKLVQSQVPAPELGVSESFIKAGVQKYYSHYCGAADDASDKGQFRKALKYYMLGLFHNPFIGLQIKWGRFNHSFYHILRPYLAVARCSFMVLKEKVSVKSKTR